MGSVKGWEKKLSPGLSGFRVSLMSLSLIDSMDVFLLVACFTR